MGRPMKTSASDLLSKLPRSLGERILVLAVLLSVLLPANNCLRKGQCSLLTSDQKGHRLFVRGEYQEAAELFSDPMWKAVALFEQGEFKEAGGVCVLVA